MSEILEQWHFSNKCLSTKIFFESLYPVTFSQISKTFLSQKLFSVVDAFQTLPKGWCSTYSVVSETSYGKYTSKRIFCLHVVVKMSPKLIYLTIFIWAVVFLEESFAKGGVGKNSARRKILVCIKYAVIKPLGYYKILTCRNCKFCRFVILTLICLTQKFFFDVLH